MSAIRSVLPHLLAAGLALGFAWTVSRTGLVRSGVQFVAPGLVIVLAHLAWAALARGLVPGYALRVLGRSAGTGAWLLVAVILGQLIAPLPAQANSDTLKGVLVVIMCVVILAAAVAAVVIPIWLIVRAIYMLFQWLNRSNDLGTLVAVLGLLAVASLEGVPGTYRFASEGRGAATVQVAAPPADVWAAMETATSPAFPLPPILRGFPQPVAVETDEGTRLGGRRVVRLEGREGAGRLTLEVVARTPERLLRMEVLSDRSPMANWIGLEAITYDVQPAGDGSRLSVALEFERRLAPAALFGPMMRGAGALAMGVLARDVKARAEAGSGGA